MNDFDFHATDAAVLHFYSRNGGVRMFVEAYRTPAVKAYLDAEATLLLDEPAFDHLFEVGCGDGRYLRWALDHGLHYDGLDMVPWLIEQGRHSLGKSDPSPLRCKLHVGSAEDLHGIWTEEKLEARAGGIIVFFPFNCFGSVARPERVATSTAMTGARIFLSMFSTSKNATAERQRYYAQNGFTEIDTTTTDRGVMCTSAEGLRSFAYDRGYLEQVFDSVGYVLSRVVTFESIAMGYLFQPRDSSQSRTVRASDDSYK